MKSIPVKDPKPLRFTLPGIILLVAAFVICPILRLQQVPHLLTWDEAMNVCSVKALASLASDDFSNWIWRHPPLYMILTRSLAPLSDGFAVRIEVMNVCLCTLNLILLFIFTRRYMGFHTAAAAVFILAAMPGSIFFDVWIKRDHLAITFALLSLILVSRDRLGYASLMAGLGFLTKETFLFLYMPILLLAILTVDSKHRRWVRFAIVTIIPLLTSGWWFVLASRNTPLSSISGHVTFATASGAAWYGAPTFYFLLLGRLVGLPGLALLATSLIFLIANIKHSPRLLIWPLAPLLVPLILLSLLPRKVPWIVIVLLPALASLQAIALGHFLDLSGRSRKPMLISVSILTVFGGALLLPALTHNHDAMLERVAPDQYRGASRSRETAVRASELITDCDRVLLTSFHYWRGVVPGQMCPVFACYFKPKPAILPVPYETPFEEMVRLIAEHNLNWAIVSPMPGDQERDIIGGFIDDAGLPAVKLPYACIIDTSSLLEEPAASGVFDKVPEAFE